MRRKMVMVFLIGLAATTMLWSAGETEGTGATGSESIVNVSGFPIVKEPITLKAVARMSGYNVPFEDLDLLQDYEQETGITIEWTSIPGSDWVEKMNLLLATAEYPDFVYGSLPGNIAELGAEGIILPLNDLIAKWSPNLTEMLSRHPIAEAISTYPDGNIYSLPMYDDRVYHSQIPRKMFINHEWLDTLGLAMPTTTDEFYEVLKAFKSQDPNGNGKEDEIPLAFWTGNDGNIRDWTMMLGPWGVVDTLMIEDGSVYWGFLKDGFKEGCKYYQKLYNEGLLDLESITQTQNQVKSKSVNSEGEAVVGTTYSLATWFVVNNNDWTLMFNGAFGTFKTKEELTKNPSFIYDAMLPLEGPAGDSLWRRQMSGVGRGRASVFSQTEYPEAIARWFDTWYDGKERSYQTRLGKLGETIYLDDGIIMRSATPEGMSVNEWQHQFAPGSVSTYYIDQKMMPMAVQPVVYMLEIMTDRYMPHAPEEYWPGGLIIDTPEEAEMIVQYEEELMTYVFETMGRFIAGDVDIDSEWDGFVRQCSRMKTEDLLQIRQDQYDRFLNSLPSQHKSEKRY
jgi:putative aldouronate transport system substrate-binding protein